jgi:L-2-hydroxyglutarate oxidase LhgO
MEPEEITHCIQKYQTTMKITQKTKKQKKTKNCWPLVLYLLETCFRKKVEQRGRNFKVTYC